MFTQVSNGSKIAFVHLVNHLSKHDYQLIDCQVYTQHLSRLGAKEISRANFETILQQNVNDPVTPECWQAQPLVLE